MKKTIIISLICSSLFANDLDKAIELFEQNKFQESIEILTKLSLDDLSNNDINFYLGQSYYKLGKYEDALIYFERIILVDESNLRTQVELAQTYLMLGLDYDALEHFNYVLNHNIPSNVRKNIEAKIKYIEDKKDKNIFNALISLGYTYDTNVNNITDLKEFNTPTLSNIALTDKQVSDTNLLLLLNGNHQYKVDDKYILQNKLNVVKQNYTTQTQKNIVLFSYNLNLLKYHKQDKFTYGFNYVKLDMDNRSYLDMIGLSFSYQKKVLKDTYSFLSFNYSEKSFNQPNTNLDSTLYSIILGNTFPTDSYGKFNSIYTFTNEDLLDNNSPDKITHNINLSNNYKISSKLTANSSLSKSIINEQSNDSIFLIRREDILTNISVGLSYNIDKTTNISSTIKYVNNISNIGIYSYDKQTFDIFISKTF